MNITKYRKSFEFYSNILHERYNLFVKKTDVKMKNKLNFVPNLKIYEIV